MYLLTSDWHLTDQPEDEYRWRIFDHIIAAAAQYPVNEIFILGDIVDRKDRFPASFVNRLVESLTETREAAGCPVIILRGNHDTTLRPPNFWEFLNEIPGIQYVTGTTIHGNILLLPFAANPKEEWRHLRLSDFKAVFMHATVSGVVVGDGVVLENDKMPILPRGCKIYSGDIHHPQRMGSVEYVGAPHPVKFGDDYHCRMLLLDEQTCAIAGQIDLPGPRKLMANIKSLDDLKGLTVSSGDQIKIRLNCKPEDIEQLDGVQAGIAEWARRRGLNVAGTEIIVNTRAQPVDINQSPTAILQQFAEQQGLSESVLALGLELLREVE